MARWSVYALRWEMQRRDQVREQSPLIRTDRAIRSQRWDDSLGSTPPMSAALPQPRHTAREEHSSLGNVFPNLCEIVARKKQNQFILLLNWN